MYLPVRLFLFIAFLATASGCTPSAMVIENMTAKELFSNQHVVDLVLAAEMGDTVKMKEAISAGADVNAKGKYNVTPLMRSTQKKNKVGYKTLLDLGANPNVCDGNGFSPMHLAAE